MLFKIILRINGITGYMQSKLFHQAVPLYRLANKQDKMNALLGVELIEVLSLEKLVNQSQSLCHVVSNIVGYDSYLHCLSKFMNNKDFLPQKEPCSALIDLRRWSDRRTLRGLRWLLRAVGLDYSDLCARVVRDCERQPGPEEREREAKTGQSQKKNKVERCIFFLNMFEIALFYLQIFPFISTRTAQSYLII